MSQDNDLATLGLGRGSSPDDVKAAFRRLAKIHHPDQNPGAEQSYIHKNFGDYRNVEPE